MDAAGHTLATYANPVRSAAPLPAPLSPSPAIARLEADIAATDPASAVARFWDAHPIAPVVDAGDADGERIVTFVWRDAGAAEVLLFANRLTDERAIDDSLLRRVPGTDVWWLAYRMRADWRASYSFLVRREGERAPWRTADDQVALRAALDHGFADPRNPDGVRNRAGTRQSVVSLPDAPPQPWREAAEATRATRAAGGVDALGALDAPDGRTVWVHEPAGTHLDQPLPVVLVLDGEVWLSAHDLPGTVDAMVDAGRLRPVRLVLVDSGGVQQRWRDLDADGDGVGWLCDRLLPWLATRFALPSQPEHVVVAGQSLGGSTALRAALLRPDVIGAALAQSASTWQSDFGELAGQANRRGTRVWLEVGLQEWVLLDAHRVLADDLRRAGAEVAFREFNGGHDYACWRGGIADGLAHLLPPVDAAG